MVMMPYNPPYYLRLVEAAGFEKAKDLYASRCLVANGWPERLDKIARRAGRGLDVSIELVDIARLDQAVADFKDIYNSAWEKNWGFVPMTDEELDEMAAALKPILKPDYLFFARVDGKPAGAALLLPDLNIPLSVARGALTPFNILPFLWKMKFSMNRGRMLTLGVKKEFRNRGLEILLIKQGLAAAKKMGWEYGEVSWTLEDNDKINNAIEAVGGTVYKKYRLYEKKL
jgi:GNAT superfamily N-acetyltransferase